MTRATLLGRAASRLRGAEYLRKWIILGVIIGVVAGLGAIAFTWALRLATEFFLGVLAGYTPPAPLGEGATFGSGAVFSRPWAIPLVVALGGLISGVLVFSFAPEAEGHGTDAAISAVHHNPRGIRARVSFIKIVASAITIGSGGSAGREGPTAQISAGFGSMLARWLDLTPGDARIAVTVGIGAGIGAIFRAPLGGAVLGAEVLYREDVEADALIPSIVASIVGFAVFGAVEGFAPIFGSPSPSRAVSNFPAVRTVGSAATPRGARSRSAAARTASRSARRRRSRARSWGRCAFAKPTTENASRGTRPDPVRPLRRRRHRLSGDRLRSTRRRRRSCSTGRATWRHSSSSPSSPSGSRRSPASPVCSGSVREASGCRA